MSAPIVAAPMAGGPSTPELVAAVGNAGGLGFLAAGYRPASQLRDQIHATRQLTPRAFGVNVFVPGPADVDQPALASYAARLQPVADRLGVALGEPRWDDDDYGDKLDLLVAERSPIVSFTFGCPAPADIERLHRCGALVIVTVTSAAEAALARDSGADGLCVQGAEAGAHRGVFYDDPSAPPGADALELLPLLRQVLDTVRLPAVAAGGLMTDRDVATVRANGAVAAQLGTAFLACPEAGTNDTHRRALLAGRYATTGFTRAFTGRTARGLVNGFFRDHHAAAPAGYPWVHHLTRPLRTAAAQQGDADALHLWAGQGWQQIQELPAAELVARFAPAARGDLEPG